MSLPGHYHTNLQTHVGNAVKNPKFRYEPSVPKVLFQKAMELCSKSQSTARRKEENQGESIDTIQTARILKRLMSCRMKVPEHFGLQLGGKGKQLLQFHCLQRYAWYGFLVKSLQEQRDFQCGWGFSVLDSSRFLPHYGEPNILHPPYSFFCCRFRGCFLSSLHLEASRGPRQPLSGWLHVNVRKKKALHLGRGQSRKLLSPLPAESAKKNQLSGSRNQLRS